MRLIYVVWLNIPPLRPLADRLMRVVFGRLAASWDSRTDRESRLDPLWAALELIDAPRRVIELGCGTGSAAIALSKRLTDSWVVGLDASAKMIDRAVSNAAAAGAAVVFELGQIQATGFDDESFELVVLVNAPPPFREISRLLRRDAAVVVVFSDGSDTPFYSSHGRLERGFRRAGLSRLDAGAEGSGEYFVAIKR